MKAIYVLNIIIQSILEEKKGEKKGSQKNVENSNFPNRRTKIRKK
jgi:hypothetical protein